MNFPTNINLLWSGGCDHGMAQANRARFLDFLKWTGLTESGSSPWWGKSNCNPDVAALMWLKDTNQPPEIVLSVKTHIAKWTQENQKQSNDIDELIKRTKEDIERWEYERKNQSIPAPESPHKHGSHKKKK